MKRKKGLDLAKDLGLRMKVRTIEEVNTDTGEGGQKFAVALSTWTPPGGEQRIRELGRVDLELVGPAGGDLFQNWLDLMQSIYLGEVNTLLEAAGVPVRAETGKRMKPKYEKDGI